MGRKRDRTGIAGFFDDLGDEAASQPAVKPTVKKPEKTKPNDREENPNKQPTPKKADASQPRPTTSMTRTGRPPGRKDGEGPLRTRATLWLSAELIEAYRERTWEERCHLGELVERALFDYRNRNWGETGTKT